MSRSHWYHAGTSTDHTTVWSSLSWSGGVRKPDGHVYWIDRDGEVR